MVLLDDVIQVGRGATAAAPTQSPLRLQSADRLGMREVTVHIDDARTGRLTPPLRKNSVSPDFIPGRTALLA